MNLPVGVVAFECLAIGEIDLLECLLLLQRQIFARCLCVLRLDVLEFMLFDVFHDGQSSLTPGQAQRSGDGEKFSTVWQDRKESSGNIG